MKKLLLFSLPALFALTACQDKTLPEPEPEEYFSFYADGQYHNYPQKKENLFGGGTWQALKAKKIGTTEYEISGQLSTAPKGAVILNFSTGHIPTQDTVTSFYAHVIDLNESSDSYWIEPSLGGKVIFSERSSTKLTGFFEFQAKNNEGKVLTITNGKFSIIPTN